MSKLAAGVSIVFIMLFNIHFLHAQTYVFGKLTGSPVNTTGWNFNGAAYAGNVTGVGNSEIILCPNALSSSGAIFYDKPINLSICNNWVTEFDFRIYDGTRADGLAFCFLEVPPSGFVSGGGLGIPGTANGLKVCFDQFPNCPPYNASDYPKIELRYGIGYNECTAQPTVKNTAGNLSFIYSPAYKHARITYNRGNISVYVDNNLYLTGFQTFNFTGYIGFCAGTGAASDNHSIKNVIIYTDMPPSIAGVSKNICSNEPVQLGTAGNADYIYSWTPSTGLSATDISNPTVSLLNNADDALSQKYYVNTSFSSSPGCTSVDSVIVTINAIPAVSISASANNICQGIPVTFTASAIHGGPAPTYKWKKNGADVGNNSSAYTDNALNNGDILSCILTANVTCAGTPEVSSNDIKMIVSDLVTPSLNITPSANNICKGTGVTFTAVPVNGGATPVFQWKLNGADVGTNNAVFTTDVLSDGDLISCIVTGNSTCATIRTATSNTINVQVKPIITPSVTIAASGNDICPNGGITFTATPVNGGATPVYQWKVNGVNTGTNSATYSSSSLVNRDLVTCVLTGNAACASVAGATSNSIEISVKDALIPAVSITASVTDICAGQVVTFTATPVNGGSTPVYQWKKNGNNVGSNAVSYTSDALENGDIVSCQLTTSVTCSTTPVAVSNDIKITAAVLVTPAVTITSSANNICNGTAVTFTAVATNAGNAPVYNWKLNGMDAGTNSPSFTSDGFVNGDIVSCTLTGNSRCVTGNTASSNSVVMAVKPIIAPSLIIAASANDICSGNQVIFTAVPVNGGSAPVYQWKINGMNTGTNDITFNTGSLSNNDIVTCEMISNAACTSVADTVSNSIKMIINTRLVPSVSIISSDTTICTGQNVTFRATAVNGGAAPTYQWKINGLNAGTNSSFYSSASLSNGDVVSCQITGSAGCTTMPAAASGNIRMVVLTPPFVNISISKNPSCVGDELSFTASAAGSGSNPVYQWKLNGISTGTGSVSFSGNNFSDNDHVTCMVMPGTGSCSSAAVVSNTEIIIINTLPDIRIIPADTTIFSGNRVQLSLLTPVPLNNYQWLPVAGLNDPGSLSPFTIALNATTDYLFKANTADGCLVTAKTTVKVYQNLFIPNAFTPDKNGLNDVFRIPPHVALKLKDFSIFDRWGRKVFVTQNISEGWDGSFNGIRQPGGVYIFIVRGNDNKGPVLLKGSFILIR